MSQDNQIGARPLSLGEFITSPAGSELLAAADAAFGRVDFGNAVSFLHGRLSAMAHLHNADDLTLGELLEQVEALRSTVDSLNGFAVAFHRQSGRLALAVEAIKVFSRHPTATNRIRLLEAAGLLDGYKARMPPRVRRLLRPYIKASFWRRDLLSYGRLYLAVSDHMREEVVLGLDM